MKGSWSKVIVNYLSEVETKCSKLHKSKETFRKYDSLDVIQLRIIKKNNEKMNNNV